mgnify:FL=1
MKDLIILAAHLDDFELGCVGYIIRHHKEYDNIRLYVATNNDYKEPITIENVKQLSKYIGKNIDYSNLNYGSTKLKSQFDDLKDDFYKLIDFNSSFDLLTHDEEDLHTDHTSCSDIARGLFKYCESYITLHSPSCLKFSPNYFIPLSEDDFKVKAELIQKYDIQKDHSYSKIGYYLSDEYLNIGKAYVMENYVRLYLQKHKYFDIYNLKKWSSS